VYPRTLFRYHDVSGHELANEPLPETTQSAGGQAEPDGIPPVADEAQVDEAGEGELGMRLEIEDVDPIRPTGAEENPSLSPERACGRGADVDDGHAIEDSRRARNRAAHGQVCEGRPLATLR
jgi:hypothetical protein